MLAYKRMIGDGVMRCHRSDQNIIVQFLDLVEVANPPQLDDMRDVRAPFQLVQKIKPAGEKSRLWQCAMNF